MNDLSLSDLAAWLDERLDARVTAFADSAGWNVSIVGANVSAAAWADTVGDAFILAMTRYEERARLADDHAA